MARSHRFSPAQLGLPFLLFIGFLAICVLGGGASRVDVQSLFIVRIAAILLIVALLLQPRRLDLRQVRAPLLFIGLCALVVGAQLIPLPPDVWTSLPGRSFYAEAAAAAGLEQPWRPISLTPDLTINSLLSLLPPLAAVLAMSALPRNLSMLMLPVLIGVALLSATLGVVQISAGGDAFTIYRISNEGAPIGFFANRNHQAALLALALPMLTLWAFLPSRSGTSGPRPWIALAAALLLFPLILVAGSRAGLLLSLAGLFLSLPLAVMARSLGDKPPIGRRAMAYAAAAVAVLGTVVGITLYLARAEALSRLMESSFDEETRWVAIPPVLRMIGEFFPLGAGFGSFESVFRRFEPFGMLDRRYFNHAHNDLLELLTDAGLFGAALLVLFLIWWVIRAFMLWFRSRKGSTGAVYGQLGSVMTLLLLVASLGDYPLRTPLMAVIFAIACVWMCKTAERPRHEK